MTIKKDQAIQLIQDNTEEMAELILGQLRELDNIFSSGEPDMTEAKQEKFHDDEREIDKFEIKISDEFINIVSLHKPVASELRKVITCYRLSINLERIGDMAVKILRVVLEVKNQSLIIDYMDEISSMLIMTNNMVEKSILSFFNSDIEYAVWTLKNDDVIDKINRKMIKKIIRKYRGDLNDPQAINNFINIKIIVSNIERIADHATNIAEASIYYLRGQDVRHTRIEDIETGLGEGTSGKNK
jgi:phosphate transport system protein